VTRIAMNLIVQHLAQPYKLSGGFLGDYKVKD